MWGVELAAGTLGWCGFLDVEDRRRQSGGMVLEVKCCGLILGERSREGQPWPPGRSSIGLPGWEEAAFMIFMSPCGQIHKHNEAGARGMTVDLRACCASMRA